MNLELDSKACRQRRFQLESFRRDRLYFAQVREDPNLEIGFLEPTADSTYVVVGSGGCTALSLLALALFGILVVGRQFAGWRGKRAVYLYLWGFFFLCLAYFGSRYVLENVLGRAWG